MSIIESRLALVKQRILEAEKNHGRTIGAVTLLAVSKGQTVENIQLACKAGQKNFGENYIQEALQKINALQGLNLHWHFIGQIQSNKTRDIATAFDWVHSVDKVQTAKRLSQQRPETLPSLNICLQVNLDQENTKAGFSVETLQSAAEEIANLPNLKLRGLMAIPEARDHFETQRQPFSRLKQMLHHLNQSLQLRLDTLSMGMSADLEAAIAEGATLVRIGTAIFGPRQRK